MPSGGGRPMSALGQKQTFAVHQPMSALRPKATLIAFWACLLWPIADIRAGEDRANSLAYLPADQ
jgi:hypothetical protein